VIRRGLLLACVTAAAAACVTERVEAPQPNWTLTAEEPFVTAVGGEQEAPLVPDEDLLALIEPARPEDLEPDYLSEEAPSPFHRLGRDVIRGMDGSWSKMYTLKSERTSGVLRILQAHVPGFPLPTVIGEGKEATLLDEGLSEEGIRWVLHPGFYSDNTGKLGVKESLTNTNIGDLLVVTAPPATLLFIDELLGRLLADLPQIEIQVRVVEVNLDDLIEWDSKVGIAALEDPSQPYDPDTNPQSGQFGSGFPILEDGDPSGYGSAFGSFSTPDSISGFLTSVKAVWGDLSVDALLSLLQTIGASELISSPTITVLNGHRAIINTGDRVPVFQASGVGTNVQVTTKFEDTGVRVEIIPFIVGEDVIRVDLSVAVSAVTSEVPVILAGAEVSSPVISTRDAGTTVHVHSGQVLAVGGLRASSNIETITKVPLLGDIPLIGWLFKSRSSRQRNNEIVFFITPTIRIPSETLLAPGAP
jgi:type II secretory pathway component GspD/PulD (secretin)